MDEATTKFLMKSEQVLRDLRTRMASRDGEVSRHELECMVEAIERMRTAVMSDDLPEPRYKVLSRNILDVWPNVDKLGDAIMDLETQYVRL